MSKDTLREQLKHDIDLILNEESSYHVEDGSVFLFEEPLNRIMMKVEEYAESQDRERLHDINTWLIQNDQASMDDRQMVIDSGDWLKYVAEHGFTNPTNSSLEHEGEPIE